jgi:hypothetical protein
MTADHAKAIPDYFAEMFDRQCANTLKVLRAVPNDRRDYKPDEKSRTAWDLAACRRNMTLSPVGHCHVLGIT